MSFLQKFLHSFSGDEPGFAFMWILLLVFVFAFALAIERGIYLVRRSSFNPNNFMKKIFGLVEKDNIKEAVILCKKSSAMALSAVIKAGLESATGGADKINNAIEEATLNTVPLIEKRTNYLAMIGNVATLIGLMGTIYGLILSFAAVGAPGIDPAQKSALLAQGISAAMNTTLSGLAIAIPCIIVFTFYHSKTEKIINDIDEHSLKLANILTERSFRVQKYHISTEQIKEGIGIHVTHNKVQVYTDNNLIKEITI